MHTSQLTLPLKLRSDATFENFVGAQNIKCVAMLRAQLNTAALFTYLSGQPGSGKTHLLSALCHEASAQGKRVMYLSVHDVAEFSDDLIEGLEHFDLVCIDDIDGIFGKPLAEQTLFHFFNRIRDMGHQLVVSATILPGQIEGVLPDLVSRLSSGVVVQALGLTEEEKSDALKMLASERGMHLGDEVVSYIMKRSGRSLGGLIQTLEVLDDASLKAHRKITVPFVKELFGW